MSFQRFLFSCAATILPGKVVRSTSRSTPAASRLGVSQLAGAPSIEAVRKTSVARVARIMSLCAAAAIASWVAMKRVPI